MAKDKDLPHRTWSALRESWLEHIPTDFSPSDINALSLVKQAVGKIEDKAAIPLISGLREHAFTDALFIRAKSLYCIQCGINSNDRGFSTWSSMAMYEACFFSA